MAVRRDPAQRPITRRVTCTHPGGAHAMAYHVWEASPARPLDRTVVCVHGLTRNGRDFDPLAARLVAAGYRVVCPDLPGRGLSDRLPDASMYQVGQYVSDCRALIAALDVDAVDWIGTSLGGLVGLVLAARENSPIERLVLNDIGPRIEDAGLERIRGYVGDCAVHDDFVSAERSLRRTMQSFGPHDDAQFRSLSEHYFVPAAEGGVVAHYDPAIADVIVAGGSGAPPALWDHWSRIRVPVLTLRGAESDVLSAGTAARMASDDPGRVRCSEFEGVGHAPTLIADDQVDCVLSWLADTLPAVEREFDERSEQR